jgi:hypothetical protein
MSGRSDEIPANAEVRARLRASHADRDQVLSVLKTAFVQGMLTKREFDERIGQTMASRTHAELAALTEDIPPGLAAAQPLSEPQPDSADKRELKAWACVTTTFTAVAAVVAAATAGSASGLADHELAVVIFVPVVAVVVGVLLLFHTWLDSRAGKRTSQRMPRRPSGDAPQRSASAAIARPPRRVNRRPLTRHGDGDPRMQVMHKLA